MAEPTTPGLATIGVYGFSLDSFLDALGAAGVVQVLDVRQRRGVRGPEYAWANARRLIASLRGAGLSYEHHRELAPTTELRQAQYAEDARAGVGKRNRSRLAPVYRDGYSHQILDHVDLAPLVAGLPSEGRAALLCVEADPEACHRSIVADRITEHFGIPVRHLRPPAR